MEQTVRADAAAVRGPTEQPRSQLPVGVMVLVGLVCALGLLVSVLALGRIQAPSLKEGMALIAFTALAMAAHFRPTISLTNQATYSTVVASYFCMVLLLPPGWLPICIILGWVPYALLKLRSKPTWVTEVGFNAASDLMAAEAAAAIMRALLPLVPGTTLWLLPAGLAFILVQTGLVTAAVVTYRRIRWREAESLQPGNILADFIMVLVGGMVALLYQLDPTNVILVFVPLAYLQHLLHRFQTDRTAYIEPKTGLYNYRYLDERLAVEVERALANSQPLSVIFGDLDLLRDINNTYGHYAGDAAIRAVAAALQQTARPHDFAARFGGEEYVLVLPNTDKAAAARVAETVRRRVAETPTDVDDSIFHITMSLGVASCPEDATSVANLVKAADQAVYRSKAAGRNRVTVCGREVL